MHGTELRSQNRRALSLRLPTAFVRRQRFNASGLACQLSWPEPVSRSGLSLSRNDCPFPGPHSEVKAPDLLLRCLAKPSPSPFGCRLRRSSRFPGWGDFGADSPLPGSRSAFPVYPRIFTPLWGLSDPFGSKRSTRFLAGKPAFRVRPIASHSPMPVLFD